MDLLKSKPEKAINNLIKHVTMLESGETEKAKPKLTGDIQTIHKMLYGDSDNEPKKSDIDHIVPQLCSDETDLFRKLTANLKEYDFESKKKIAEIMNYIVRRTGKDGNPFADYLAKNKSIVTDLLKGYHDPNLSQNVGSVLQEMCKRSELSKILLNTIRVKVHAYNDWEQVLKANQAAAADADANANAGKGKGAGAAPDKGGHEDAQGPGMPDWNRQATNPDADNNNQASKPEANGKAGSPDKAPSAEPNASGNGNANANANAKAQKEEKKEEPAAAAVAAPKKKDERKEEKKECNDMVDELFILVQNPSFDIASDAYKTLELLLTRHKKEVSKYLDANYTLFFMKFNYLIMSDNYVTKRQFLKLLGVILLDKHNFKVMIAFISEKANLISAMKLIKSPSKAIAFEAFHIFKVFVANPNKSRDVHIILYKNKDQLCKFLNGFLKDKEDNSFISEKEIVIQHLTSMEIPEEIREKLEERRRAEEELQKQQQANAEDTQKGGADDGSANNSKDDSNTNNNAQNGNESRNQANGNSQGGGNGANGNNKNE